MPDRPAANDPGRPDRGAARQPRNTPTGARSRAGKIQRRRRSRLMDRTGKNGRRRDRLETETTPSRAARSRSAPAKTGSARPGPPRRDAGATASGGWLRSVDKNRNAPAIVSAAEYFEESASPEQIPAASHQPHAARPCADNALIRHNTAPSNAAINGPSGKTQLAEVMPSTGAAFSTAAAHRPARSPNSAAVSRYISTVDSTNSAINGSRTITGLSLPARCAAPQASHQAIGRMIEIAELPLAPGRDHVALVDAEAERRRKQQPQRKSACNQQDQRARQGSSPTAIAASAPSPRFADRRENIDRRRYRGPVIPAKAGIHTRDGSRPAPGRPEV